MSILILTPGAYTETADSSGYEHGGLQVLGGPTPMTESSYPGVAPIDQCAMELSMGD